MAGERKEDAVRITKEEIIFCDKSDRKNTVHYRIKTGLIRNIVFDYLHHEKFFGLINEIEEAIIFYLKENDQGIPEKLIIREHNEPRFRYYKGTLRSFIDDNKLPLEIVELEEETLSASK